MAVSDSAGYVEANADGDNVHAPNEHVRLDDYFEGTRFVAEIITRPAAM